MVQGRLPIIRALILALASATAAVSSQDSSHRYALLIGCTEYPELLAKHGESFYEQSIRLYGPANDVQLFRDLLTTQFQFPPDAITTLVGWDDEDVHSRPTRGNIEAAFRALAEKVRKGDQVVVLIAGHGSFQPLPSGADPSDLRNTELDGRDEILLPADVKGWLAEKETVENAILDDELGRWLKSIGRQGALVWAIFDVCHSGTMTRGGIADVSRQRYLDPKVLGVRTSTVPRMHPRGGKSGYGFEEPDLLDLGVHGSSLVALYATQPYERAPELPLPEGSPQEEKYYHGLLSYTVCRILQQNQSPLTYTELIQRVLASYQGIPWSLPTPFGEGDLEREVLGVKRWPQRSLVRLQNHPDGLQLNAGATMGLTRGSILSVYPPAGRGNNQQVLGYVRVSRVTATTADVEPVAYADESAREQDSFPDDARCEVVYHDLGDWRIKLAVQTSQGGVEPNAEPRTLTYTPQTMPEPIAASMQELEGSVGRFVQLTDDPSAAHWFLQVENNEARLIQAGATADDPSPAGSTPVAAGPYDLSDKSGFIKAFADDVRRVYRWQNLRRLAGESATLGSAGATGGLELELAKCANAPSSECEPVPPGGRLPVGQKVRVLMRNTGRTALDVTLLMLDASFGIDALFPRAGQYGRLPPSKHHHIDLEITGDTLGKEHFVAIAVPAQRGVQRTDFTWLAQSSLRLDERTRRQGGRTPLEDLLAAAVFAEGKTRGVKLSGTESVRVSFHLITWETVSASSPDSTP